MKKKNFFSIFAQAGLALAATLLISIGLVSCSKDKNKEYSKDKNKEEEDAIYMTTNIAIEGEISLRFKKGDGPITISGAEMLKSLDLDDNVSIKYKVKAQNIAVKGFVTYFDCSDCDLTYLNVNGKNLKMLFCCICKSLKNLKINNNEALETLYCFDCEELSELDLRNNLKLKILYCHGTKITGDVLKLPEVKGNKKGSLFFKYGSDTEQKLSSAQVTKIKELNWNVFHSPKNDGTWVNYFGED